MSRPLILHVSALNDAEYTTYTSSIRDIVDLSNNHAPDYDKLSVGVREARAWLRGRYATLAPSTLDSVRRALCAVIPRSSHSRSSVCFLPTSALQMYCPVASSSRPSGSCLMFSADGTWTQASYSYKVCCRASHSCILVVQSVR